MGKPTGFMDFERESYPERPVPERVHDWKEIYLKFPEEGLRRQGARCMDCGIPFCHEGCPLGNLIPDWNDLVTNSRWKDAIDRLHATNNFPEFTGRLCPAPCEGACVLGINEKPVTIKYIEYNIIDHAFENGWVKPEPAQHKTGKRVSVVGSGPAGLACAQQLARVGHTVTVYERDDRIGGLLRYGIPDFKMEKWRIDQRIQQMEAEGVVFKPKTSIGQDIPLPDLIKNHDAIALCGGATEPRELPIPGRDLTGVHFAMEYLTDQNRVNAGDYPKAKIHAGGKRVIILGGGDTGADCLGTAHRQGASQIHQIELLPRPPDERGMDNPWPQWPLVYRVSPAHQEGGIRDYSILTKKFSGTQGKLSNLHAVRIEWLKSDHGKSPQFKEIPGSDFEIGCDLVFLSLGFLGPQKAMFQDSGIQCDARGNIATNEEKQTSMVKVFAAGDMRRGQSLIVWAIAEGRQCAKGIDKFLMGETELP